MKKQKTPRPKSQILDRLTLSRCIKCNRLVKWRITKIYKCADGKHVIRYMKCTTPGCDGSARQIGDLPD